MTIENFVVDLFYQVEDAMKDMSNNRHENLYHGRGAKVVIFLVNKEVANRLFAKRSEIVIAWTPKYC